MPTTHHCAYRRYSSGESLVARGRDAAMKERAPAFQFFPRQFAGDDQVMGMDLEAIGAHILLMIPYPHLPEVIRSMESREFVLSAMRSLGTPLVPESDGVYACKRDGAVDRVCFDDAHSSNAVLYRPGTAPFSRLVSRVVATGLHDVQDVDDNPRAKAELMAEKWVERFGGKFRKAEIQEVTRSFSGIAIVKIRATVGHDSYERLVNVTVPLGELWISAGLTGASPIADPLKNPEAVGLSSSFLIQKARQDDGVAEFCRFYIDRRKEELAATGTDPRKIKKIEDDFTPQLEAHLVGLEGSVRRQLSVNGIFELGTGHEYASSITVIPTENKITKSPELSPCSRSERIAPRDCLARCEMSGSQVLKHLLVKSEASDRVALPEFIGTCAVSGKRALRDELEQSAVTQQTVLKSILKSSGLSAKRAEPQFFAKCEFTGLQALEDELSTSQVSGKKYRKDKQQRSTVTGKTGYVDEFVLCAATQLPLLDEETERCDVTNKRFLPGLLVRCEVTGKKALPSLLEKSAATGKVALKTLFVSSRISGARLLEDESIPSATGKHCLLKESKLCVWSGMKCHPDDLRTCQLTHVTAHFEFMTTNGQIRLEPLVNLLNGLRRKTDKQELWPTIAANVSQILDARSQVEAAVLSPGGEHLAVCLETRNWLGLKTRRAGLLYAIRDHEVVGRIVTGKRVTEVWGLEKII